MKAVSRARGVSQGRRTLLVGGVALSSLPLRKALPACALEVGAQAPEFSLPSTGGGEMSLDNLSKSSKYSVVYFYNQDGSPGCSLEAARFQQGLSEFEKRNTKVVGVSMDSVESHDTTGEISKAYGADLSIPLLGKFSDRQTFLIDSSTRRVIGHWLEKDFSMKNVKAPLGPGSHVQQIIDKIDELS